MFGIVPLVLLPAGSLLPTLLVAEADFWNYTFPISCISIAGIYDAYGRMEASNQTGARTGGGTSDKAAKYYGLEQLGGVSFRYTIAAWQGCEIDSRCGADVVRCAAAAGNLAAGHNIHPDE